SVTVPMWMSVAVAPLSLAVLAGPLVSPGLHTLDRSPKPPLARAVAPPADPEAALGELDAAGSADGLPLRLHDAATSTRTTASATPRNRFIGCSPRYVSRSNVRFCRVRRSWPSQSFIRSAWLRSAGPVAEGARWLCRATTRSPSSSG